MADSRTIIIAQFFISCMMAFLMTGFFAFLNADGSAEWLRNWANAFLIAWPIAFVLSLGVGKLGFMMAEQVTRRLAQGR